MPDLSSEGDASANPNPGVTPYYGPPNPYSGSTGTTGYTIPPSQTYQPPQTTKFGAAPAGSRQAFATAVLQRLNIPVNDRSLTMMMAWMQSEGTQARFNPLATSLGLPGSTAFNYNKAGKPLVRNYTSFEQGVDATVRTIRGGLNTYGYGNILNALRTGDYQGFAQAVGSSKWGTSGQTIASVLRVGVGVDYGQGTFDATGTPGSNIPGTPGYTITPGQVTAFSQELKGAGFTLPFDVSHLIHDALTNSPDDPFDYFVSQVIKSPQFKSYYIGIFNPNGTLKMKPVEYEQAWQDAQHYAAAHGLNITRRQFGGGIVGMNKSIDEFRYDVDSAAFLRSNAAALDQFQQLSGHKFQNAQGALDFIYGRSTKEVDDLYEQTFIGTAAKEAGVNASTADIRQLAGANPEHVDYQSATERFRQIKQQADFAGPELLSFGISQKDLELLAFNGHPGQQAAAAKVQRALEQRRAALEGSVAAESLRLSGSGLPVVAGPVRQAGL